MGKYPVDRRITRQECDDQLHQKQHLDIEPAYQLSVIRMNSTYLELVDKYFGWKGFLTTFMGSVFLMLTWGLGSILLYSIMTPGRMEQDWVYLLLFFLVMGLPGYFFLYKGAHYEAFAYTHYPIRFNRKTRMVHVFRLNGTVLSVPWDDVFFCMAALSKGFWEIQGQVMAPDGVTVRETFPLAPIVGSRSECEKFLPTYWEFIRRYMEEEGPAIADYQGTYLPIKAYLPILHRRESFWFAFHRMHYAVGGAPLPLQAMIFLIYLTIYPGRYIAMRTSKIPQWPQEIEAVNVVEPNDPYFRDASMNPKD
jgi:hypothetical protein